MLPDPAIATFRIPAETFLGRSPLVAALLLALTGCGDGGAPTSESALPEAGPADVISTGESATGPNSALSSTGALALVDTRAVELEGDPASVVTLLGLVDVVRDDRFSKPSIALSASFHDIDGKSARELITHALPDLDTCILEIASVLETGPLQTVGARSVALNEAAGVGERIEVSTASAASLLVPLRRDSGPDSYYSDGELTLAADESFEVRLPAGRLPELEPIVVAPVAPPTNVRVVPPGPASADTRLTWNALGGLATVIETDHAWIDMTSLRQGRLRCMLIDDGDFSMPEALREAIGSRLDDGTSGSIVRVQRQVVIESEAMLLVAARAEAD